MTHRSKQPVARCAAALTLVLGAAAGLAAQEKDTFPPGYPRWDVSGGLGIHYLHRSDLDVRDSWWETKAQTRAQIGWYVTPHVKAEFSLAGPTTYELYEDERLPVAGLPAGLFAITTRTLKLATLSPSATYQFFENTFAHPFLSAGLDVHVGDDHRERLASTYTINRVSYPVSPIDTRRTLVFGRPFVAAGFKSYFNDRTFVRPEVHTSFSRTGASQVSLRLDVGVDF